MTTDESTERHPTDGELAAYLGKELRGDALRVMESHLAQCPQCREEVMDASEILGSQTRHSGWGLGSGRRYGRRVLVPLLAAAAAMVLFFSIPRGDDLPTPDPIHREAPGDAGSAPALLSPTGPTSEARTFVWARTPGADRYRLTLFADDGSVLWRETTSDSLLSLPDSVALAAGRPYLWQVEARVGWDLWEASGLTEFRLERGAEAEGQDTSGRGGQR